MHSEYMCTSEEFCPTVPESGCHVAASCGYLCGGVHACSTGRSEENYTAAAAGPANKRLRIMVLLASPLWTQKGLKQHQHQWRIISWVWKVVWCQGGSYVIIDVFEISDIFLKYLLSKTRKTKPWYYRMCFVSVILSFLYKIKENW